MKTNDNMFTNIIIIKKKKSLSKIFSTCNFQRQQNIAVM